MTPADSEIDPVAATVATADSPPPVSGAGVTVTDPGSARPAAPAAHELVGTTLAHFRIDRLLGQGGMGEVYLATDLALDRQVAVKVLARDIADEPRLRRRFFREARAQARLQHPNVCHIYFIGEERGLTFFAMEYIDGESLQERLDRAGALPADQAVELCRLAALGLREANQHGFTHRDVKPSNLMVGRGGALKVVDFGLVKETAEAEPGKLSGADTTIDGTTVVGTPRYMPPEQARGEPVDFRSDIYSLGATLHHLVAGAPPFDGASALAVVSQHLTEPRPQLESARRSRRRGPAPLDVLCDRMMAKEPGRRFQSYDDLIGAMENASPARTRPAGFWVRSFALALDLLVVTLLTLPLDMILPERYDVIGFGGVALLYSILGHARWGRTLGKLALEIEVVAVDRHGPLGLRGAALRFAAQWGLLVLLAALAALGGQLGLEWLGAFGTVAGLSVFFLLYPLEGIWASWSVPGNRTFWDRAAGTRVRYRRLRVDLDQSSRSSSPSSSSISSR